MGLNFGTGYVIGVNGIVCGRWFLWCPIVIPGQLIKFGVDCQNT